MTFTENSFLVRFYVRKINEGTITKEQIPALFNLQEEVNKLLTV